MASELERFRDHCRAMADALHTVECDKVLADWADRKGALRWLDVPDPGPRPVCNGCIPPKDRALFIRLADEVDAYLANDDAPLWEDA